jgi:hypothetical protein
MTIIVRVKKIKKSNFVEKEGFFMTCIGCLF